MRTLWVKYSVCVCVCGAHTNKGQYVNGIYLVHNLNFNLNISYEYTSLLFNFKPGIKVATN